MVFIFLAGEVASLVSRIGYRTRCSGAVFYEERLLCKVVCSRGIFLMLSYLIANLTLNMDRVALKSMIGNVAVKHSIMSYP